MSDKIFVYGTLKEGHYNHSLLEEIGAEKVGDTVTEPAYTLVDLGSFPMVYRHGKAAIKGEVYKVTDLAPVDHLEGYPNLYDRIQINTKYGKAWMYVAGFDMVEEPVPGVERWEILETGEWG